MKKLLIIAVLLSSVICAAEAKPHAPALKVADVVSSLKRLSMSKQNDAEKSVEMADLCKSLKGQKIKGKFLLERVLMRRDGNCDLLYVFSSSSKYHYKNGKKVRKKLEHAVHVRITGPVSIASGKKVGKKQNMSLTIQFVQNCGQKIGHKLFSSLSMVAVEVAE